MLQVLNRIEAREARATDASIGEQPNADLRHLALRSRSANGLIMGRWSLHSRITNRERSGRHTLVRGSSGKVR